MSDKILVIGATGNVGHTLVELLAQKGEHIKAATRHPESYSGPDEVQAIHFDYDQLDTYAPALKEVDRMFVIAKPGDAEPETTLIPFLNQSKAAGLKHVVLMTARGVEQSEEVGLRQAERHLMALGIGYTILRPTWFMQNFSHGFILPMIQQSDAIYLPAGDGKTSFIDTRDIAAVAAAVLTENGHLGQEYALTGGKALTYGEAAAILSKVAGREIRYIPISDDDMRQSLSSAGWSPEQADFMVGLFFPVREGWAESVTPEVSSILGRAPITFEQFTQDVAAAFKR